MSLLADIISWALILAGSFFTLAGAFGIIRFPDLYTRMHASGVIDPFGVSLILVGLIVQAGLSLISVKLTILILFLGLTSPVACHALGRAARHRGLKPLLADREKPPSIS
ncbi:MAG: monovalent cation/H(+) antiporter subunit G [Alphaproteobacteria bacterium]|nr:monovalent cation/H(+) antiporter subunit G [Alphaproteobacteria bacterium]